VSKTDQLRQIRDEVLQLTQSPLYEYRVSQGYYPVIGMGSHDARIMFIGEAPGENEAKQAKPFVGASGRFLDELLASISIRREDVYITNVVKDRPPDNRDPRPEEIALYAPFLDRQINIIQPSVIATLGRFSMDWILRRFGSPLAGRKISELRGKIIPLTADYGEISMVPLMHPANALYNPNMRAGQFEDFKVLAQFLP
jgi:DNA polymerase